MASARPDDAAALLAAHDAEQARLMDEDTVILVDPDDNVVGAGSKKETHVWANIEKGMLHRAFSVFLLTADGRLVLQKRSDAKITFPAYWANTCCSHPLHTPSELDLSDALGVKRAARRKMQQELGIDPAEVPLSSFQFVSRIHYSAPCGDHGRPADYWGEHEIDHILICQPSKTPIIRPNPNEVGEVRAFSPSELAEWVSTAERRGDLVSPWFRLMERTMLYKWWGAAARGLAGVAEIMETDVIHRLDALDRVPTAREVNQSAMATEAEWASQRGFSIPHFSTSDESSTSTDGAQLGIDAAEVPAHFWEAAVSSKPTSSPLTPEEGNSTARKQGAYGKVVTHKENVFKQLSHLDEVCAALAYKLGLSEASKVTKLSADASANQRWCEEMLTHVSRSFAMVIQQLSPSLRCSVCVFYLVLRGLDTVEDDMIAFLGREDDKLAHLKAFYTYLEDPEWNMRGVGEGHEAKLLEDFGYVTRLYAELPRTDRQVISDICRRMGYGMARYVGRDLREGTEDIKDYNLYCHYVAGLVGEGLSRLFASSGLEAAHVAANKAKANHMGLFLQKTNIIRDYLEDLVEGRAFWPRSVWGQYADRLADLRGRGGPSEGDGRSPHTPHPYAVACLNHLVADAMTHAPHCLHYLAQLKSHDVVRFCSIPQVMAIATLDKLVSNQNVFTGVVKIRKGKALHMMQEADNLQDVAMVFLKHTRSIAAKIPDEHEAAYSIIQRAARETEETALALLPPAAAAFHSNVVLSQVFSLPTVGIVLVVLFSLLKYLYARSPVWAEAGRYLPRITDSWEVAALTAASACVLFLIAFTGVPLVLSATSPSSQHAKLDSSSDKEIESPFAWADAQDAKQWCEADEIVGQKSYLQGRARSDSSSGLRYRSRCQE